MGLIIGVGNSKPTFPYDYFYGIQWDSTVADSACTRLGRPELHVSLPIQSRMRRCLLNDEGQVVTYLHANDSTKTDTGGAADLTGASGQVMVEIPAHYRKFEVEGTIFRCLLSEYALPGFHFVPLSYRSAYEASLDRTNNKLASVVNTTAQYRGGGNNSDWDGTYRSLLGRPATAISLTNFRTYARNRGEAGLNGAGWNCDVYEIQKACYWLYAVEYANLNCQLAYNAEPTSEGYKQGGLGDGVTSISDWNGYNGYYPFVPCGVTNSLGNKTGVVIYNALNEDGSTRYAAPVPSYRGLENPFGHIWSWTDGCKCNIQTAEQGGVSEFFVCTDPAKFHSSSYDGYEKRGELPRSEGYVKAMLVGEYGENMPQAVGASSSTYFADYFYTALSSNNGQSGVLFGGVAHSGASAGLSYASTSYAASLTSAYFGSRLCFIPAAA